MAVDNENAPLTKADLKGLATKADIDGLKADVNGLKADVDSLKGNIEILRSEMIVRIEGAKMESFERIERVETTLLKEFRKWTSRNDVTLRLHDARAVGSDQRLSLLEERVADLEDRR